MLQALHTQNKVRVERKTPSPEEMEDPGIIVVDVGCEFDVRKSNYDHHQRDFTLERDVTEGYGIAGQQNPLASAGLIWLQFPVMLTEAGALQQGRLTRRDLTGFEPRVDQMLVRGIDASDCGISGAVEAGQSPTISQCISWMNPPASASVTEVRMAFDKALVVGRHVLHGVLIAAEAWCDARQVVMEAETAAESSAIVVLPDEHVPWSEHIFDRADAADLLYVVFPSTRGGYMLQQVPVKANSFDGRKPLPEAWAGLRGDELVAVTGVADATFTHAGRFCGGAESLEGTLALADLAVRA